MSKAQTCETQGAAGRRRVFHPSPAFIAAPFLPGVALFLTGAYRGEMVLGESLSAIALLITTYLISRWYRHSPLLLDENGLTLRDKTLRFEDIGSVRLETHSRRNRWRTFHLVDRNNTARLFLSPAAYGTHQDDIIRSMEFRLSDEVLQRDLIRPERGPTLMLWAATLVLVAAALLHGLV